MPVETTNDLHNLPTESARAGPRSISTDAPPNFKAVHAKIDAWSTDLKTFISKYQDVSDEKLLLASKDQKKHVSDEKSKTAEVLKKLERSKTDHEAYKKTTAREIREIKQQLTVKTDEVSKAIKERDQAVKDLCTLRFQFEAVSRKGQGHQGHATKLKAEKERTERKLAEVKRQRDAWRSRCGGLGGSTENDPLVVRDTRRTSATGGSDDEGTSSCFDSDDSEVDALYVERSDVDESDDSGSEDESGEEQSD
ncbi:hypothetical protein BD324DRAFT_620692 [Kockovaella imperatae]|uniref:Uncharacterized protein n=1 Tax=Kockovaella imperatae TaxID=4999 RepID=A0A1Y1ULK6_9TREE|nr:hypothetical protein BD324DRAFT_620692 [Kockovaella imperatae]ORX38394.1 hypothetical protein BD324DRAFT_620692 [Kockovaella imperatae]